MDIDTRTAELIADAANTRDTLARDLAEEEDVTAKLTEQNTGLRKKMAQRNTAALLLTILAVLLGGALAYNLLSGPSDDESPPKPADTGAVDAGTPPPPKPADTGAVDAGTPPPPKPADTGAVDAGTPKGIVQITKARLDDISSKHGARRLDSHCWHAEQPWIITAGQPVPTDGLPYVACTVPLDTIAQACTDGSSKQLFRGSDVGRIDQTTNGHYCVAVYDPTLTTEDLTRLLAQQHP